MNHSKTPLGTYDSFKDVCAWSDEMAQMWVEMLNLRAGAPDQIYLRKRLIEAAHLKPGDTAVEIGCGTGALLEDLARIVGTSGQIIGIEPQAALAEAARQRIASVNLPAIVKTESAARLSLPDKSAQAVLAHTVLIHLPPDMLAQALADMVRVASANEGRVISCDQDGDTWTIDHPNRELTRRIVRFNSDQRYADGWRGRSLPRLLRAAGLQDITIEAVVHTDTEVNSYLFKMAERIANAAIEAGEIEAAEGAEWIAQLNNQAAAGEFFSSINYYIACGIRRE